MSNILTDLNGLTPEELKQVGDLINTLAQKNDIEQDAENVSKPKKRRRRNKKAKAEKEVVSEYDNEPHEPEQDPTVQTQRKGRRRRAKKQLKKHGNQKGSPARTEPMNLRGVRPNEFFSKKHKWHTLHKADSKIDRKLSGGNEIEERGGRITSIEVECNICGNVYDVNPSMFYVDPKTRIPIYTCDRCISSKR